MKFPSWGELTANERQRHVLEIPLNQSLFVVGPPGSGKTVLAIQRAKMMGNQNSSVQIVTYNRMLKRLIQLLTPNVQVATMHAFVARDYRMRSRSIEVPHVGDDRFRYHWKTLCKEISSLTSIGALITCIILDEAQDFDLGFYRYICYIANVFNIFADTEQALGRQFTSYEDIIKITGIGRPIILSDNYRNCPEVARVAEYYHDGDLPAAMVKRSSLGQKPQLRYAKSEAHAARLISTWFSNRGGSIGVIVKENKYGMKLQDELKKKLPDKRVDRYSNKELNEESIDLFEPGITILNQKSVKGQEFDSVFILQVEEFLPCSSPPDKRTMYMMCSRARDFLFLVYGQRKLSKAAESSLPTPDVLERS